MTELHALAARWRAEAETLPKDDPVNRGAAAGWMGCADDLDAALREQGWRSMDSAPRDGTEVLYFRSGRICKGNYNPDKYSQKPVPYWDGDDSWHGVRWMKSNQPTAWMPLPPPPPEEPGR